MFIHVDFTIHTYATLTYHDEYTIILYTFLGALPRTSLVACGVAVAERALIHVHIMLRVSLVLYSIRLYDPRMHPEPIRVSTLTAAAHERAGSAVKWCGAKKLRPSLGPV